MAANEQPRKATVAARPEGPFQSEQARVMATAAAAPPEEETGDVKPAEVPSSQDEEGQPKVVAHDDKMVRVRPLQTLASFRYGRKVYSIKAGVECLMPTSVRDHLRARGFVG